MAEPGLGILGNIGLHLVPIAFIISDLFTIRTDGYNAPEGFDSFLISSYGNFNECDNNNSNSRSNFNLLKTLTI